VCFVCVCRSRCDCPTSVYTKQPVFDRTATYTQRVCHWLYSHVFVVCFAIVLCMLCVFCHWRGDCPTSVYIKQPVFNLTATYTQSVCHWLYYHVPVVCFAIVLWMLCVFCRSRGDCHTSVYTKQQVFNRAAAYTQREFAIDCILMVQLYVLQVCFVCFVCFAVRGVIAPRRFIQNNKCLIGRPHIHRESLSLIVFSCFSYMFSHCALYALCVLPFTGWLHRVGLYRTTSV